jgi:hypothetical protein
MWTKLDTPMDGTPEGEGHNPIRDNLLGTGGRSWDCGDLATALLGAVSSEAILRCPALLGLVATSHPNASDHERAIAVGKQIKELLADGDDREAKALSILAFGKGNRTQRLLDIAELYKTTSDKSGKRDLIYKALPWLADRLIEINMVHTTERHQPSRSTSIRREQLHLLALDKLQDISASGSSPKILVVHGSGGFGKSTFVRALVEDQLVQDLYPDGPLFVEVGEERPEQEQDGMLHRLNDLARRMGSAIGPLLDRSQASEHLRDLAKGRRFLFVLDNVWSEKALKLFAVGDPTSAHIVTTRDLTTVPENAEVIPVAQMSRAEMTSIIRERLHIELIEPHIDVLIREFRGWPLLAEIELAAILRRSRYANRLSVVVDFVIERMNLSSWRLDSRYSQSDTACIVEALTKSLDAFQNGPDDIELDLVEAALTLGLYVGGNIIPIGGIEEHWSERFGVDRRTVHKALTVLKELSIIEVLRFPDDVVVMQQVVRDALFNRALANDERGTWRLRWLSPEEMELEAMQPEFGYPWDPRPYRLR